MAEDNPIYKKIIAELGDADQGKSTVEKKIRVFNFNAQKGTIKNDPLFRGAVDGFEKFKKQDSEGFVAIEQAIVKARDDKNNKLGIDGLSPAQILDSVFDDVNTLTAEEKANILKKITVVKKNFDEGIGELKGIGGGKV